MKEGNDAWETYSDVLEYLLNFLLKEAPRLIQKSEEAQPKADKWDQLMQLLER